MEDVPPGPGTRHPRLLWGGLAVVTLVTAVVGVLSDHPWEPQPLTFPVPAVGAVFVAAGLVALRRPGSRRFGVLLIITGAAFLANVLSQLDDPDLFTVGLVIGNLAPALLAHVLLVYPTGRVPGALEWTALGLAYTAAIPITLLLGHLYDPAEHGCPQCPVNGMLTESPDPDAVDRVELLLVVVAAAAALLVVVSLVRRWRAASGPRRRALGTVLAAGAVAAALAAPAMILIGLESDASHVADVVLTLAIAAVPIAFMVGLVRDRLDREAALVTAVDDLAAAVGRVDVAEAMAAALRDPSLEIVFWAPAAGAWVWADGTPAPVPAPTAERAATVVEGDGGPLATLVHDPAIDPALVHALASGASLALERERLAAELLASTREVQRSRRRLVEASDEGRRRVERELHDGAQQRLVAALVRLRGALAVAGAPDAADLARAADDLEGGIDDLRALAAGLRPPLLVDAGLGAAVRALARRAPLPTRATAVPARRHAPEVELTAYLVVSEALTNVARHSGARDVEVAVHEDGDRLVVTVADDGTGGAAPGSGSGLPGLEDRVAALGGRLVVESPPGGGTVVRAELPVAEVGSAGVVTHGPAGNPPRAPS